jgi:hypothetical protein
MRTFNRIIIMYLSEYKTSTKNRKDLGEVLVQAEYTFTRMVKAKY